MRTLWISLLLIPFAATAGSPRPAPSAAAPRSQISLQAQPGALTLQAGGKSVDLHGTLQFWPPIDLTLKPVISIGDSQPFCKAEVAPELEAWLKKAVAPATYTGKLATVHAGRECGWKSGEQTLMFRFFNAGKIALETTTQLTLRMSAPAPDGCRELALSIMKRYWQGLTLEQLRVGDGKPDEAVITSAATQLLSFDESGIWNGVPYHGLTLKRDAKGKCLKKGEVWLQTTDPKLNEPSVETVETF